MVTTGSRRRAGWRGETHGEREGGWSRGGDRPKGKIRKKEKKEKIKRENVGKEMRSNPHTLGHKNDPTETISKPQVK